MRSITDVLAQFKQNWTEELSPTAIAQACRDAGMSWNESLLNPVVTVQTFFLQILHGNTAIQHLKHLTGMAFTASAYCQARMRVSLGQNNGPGLIFVKTANAARGDVMQGSPQFRAVVRVRTDLAISDINVTSAATEIFPCICRATKTPHSSSGDRSATKGNHFVVPMFELPTI